MPATTFRREKPALTWLAAVSVTASLSKGWLSTLRADSANLKVSVSPAAPSPALSRCSVRPS